ncbi:MAG: chorismate mutase [bacterium]|nr:chorismate mutase [bacterium]
MDKKEISKIREQIDELDLKLLYLLNQRAELVVGLATIKHAEGKKLFDPKREKDIFVRITEKNPGPLPPDAVVRLFERIIDESRRIERTEVYDRKKE